ncbi:MULTISPECIES: serine hydrolase [Streptomyces]|uniref:serine hydrolase n=1 Tax=Streptomyces TaxID=1883 RepID=UPI00103F3C0B|nr:MULTISPECIES: serine hydrolase [Streptomyces]MBT3074526.1 D-alanyl-D-alanine carboxypeptidase [Streptomyces sp. COG21]MBT3082952.1 D-alanyl-D-alanine carboxypeptidase [Streptomyces sp. COG20]MBT3090071.1 D-alanyl-D-alanine carboxypeptidase [Streptomyces sp. CYG21]MBT3099651.1 D-alanyl-D-alanine carboxypeptidase [Streptomyces sp. CBG30]MBT3105144.1 D-alanyl-D-alanine carboxypeptidase [Streptomyces sp. COG19]
MAGESPDKTEQRKSSGTAAEERDPRFAVFREPGADDGAKAADEVTPDAAGADVARSNTPASDRPASDRPASDRPASDTPTSDTATAVFRPRLPEDDEAGAGAGAGRAAGSAAAAGAASADGAASAEEPAGGADSAERTPAKAEKAEEGPAKAEEEPAEGEEESAGAGEEPAGAGKEPAGAAEGPEGAVTPQKPSEGPQGPEASGAAAKAPGADTDAEAEAAGTDERSEDEPEPGDVRLRAAVAAWVDAADGDEKPSKDEASSKDEEPSKAEAKDDAEGGGDQAAEADAKADAEAKPTANAKAGREAKAEADTAADSDSDADSGADGDTGTDSASASASETGSDLRGIDQPTAVFKAVTPPKKVDQPTTALKLPPQDKPADGDQAEPGQDKQGQDKQGKRDEPESAVERTSTFVPLRSDDVRPAVSTTAPAPAETDTDTASTTSSTPTPSAATPSWAAAERTRQQPLPPKPPLDLLAELTNTPPPPETPVRTAVRRVKIWTPLVLLLLIIFAIVQVMRPLPEPALKLTAKPTYAFEGGDTKLSWPGQGQSAVMVDGVGSLGSEGAQRSAPIASVAKVMTAYVILKEHPLKGDEQGETITADQKAEDESKNADESVAPLKNGQKLSQRQMLQLLMIPSGNNAARLLARWDAGSEDAFVDKMNDAAKDLGMTDSTYTDPSGLDKATVSTATDQLKLAQAVMKNDVFRTIVDMPEVEIEGIDGKIYNNNTLLLQPGVSGIKTGSSTPAGGNLLWSANTKVDGKVLWIYGAVMGQQAGTGRVYDSLSLSLTNSLKLIKDAQQAVTSATVVKKGDVVGYVDNGFGAQTPVVATKDLKAVGWPGLEVELKVTDNGKGIGHEAKAGSEVGMVTVGTGTGKVTAPVVLQDDLTEPAFGDKLTRIG